MKNMVRSGDVAAERQRRSFKLGKAQTRWWANSKLHDPLAAPDPVRSPDAVSHTQATVLEAKICVIRKLLE